MLLQNRFSKRAVPGPLGEQPNTAMLHLKMSSSASSSQSPQQTAHAPGTSPGLPVVIVEQLARRMRSGDQQAIAEIWELFGDDLRRRARTRLRQFGISSRAESMDVCNAVLLDLIGQNGFTLRQPADLLAYVRRAVDNQVRDLLRELTRQRRDFRRTDDRPVEDMRVTEPGPSPSREVLRVELWQKISAQLGKQGERFLEMYLARNNWQEIGQATRMTADGARMKWNRAMLNVRRELGQSGDWR